MSEWNAIRKCSDAIFPAATGHRNKHMGSTLQSDGDMDAEVNNRSHSGWNNWRKMSGVLNDKRMPPYIHKMIV